MYDPVAKDAGSPAEVSNSNVQLSVTNNAEMQLTSQTSELEAALATLTGAALNGTANSTQPVPDDLSKLLISAVGANGKNDLALAAAGAAEEDETNDKEQADKMSIE